MTLLCSFPDSWDHLVMALGSTIITFRMDDVVSSLLSKETRRKSSDSATEALAVRGRSNDRGKQNDNKSGKGRSKSHGKSKNPGKSKVKCWNCDKTGHFRKDCKEPKKKKASDSSSEKSQDDGDAFIAALVAHASDDVWFIDSGASFHMTSHQTWFSKYEVFDGGKVYLGDDSHLKIVRRGRVTIKFPDRRVKGINGVMHIPGLARNLLSVSMLNDVGVQVVFSKDGCKMMRGAMVLAKGTRRGTLFQLDACISQCNSSSVSKKRATITSSPPSEQAVKKTVVIGSDVSATSLPKGANTLEGKLLAEKTMLWHMRFCHIGEKGLRTLKKQEPR
jgi:hypothetical protein